MAEHFKLRDVLENIRKKYQNRVSNRRFDDGEWVTIKGTHVEIDDETGAITKGPDRLKTMNKPERGLASVGKRTVAKTKQRISDLKSSIETEMKNTEGWRYQKKYQEKNIEIHRDNIRDLKQKIEEHRKTIEEKYPGGKEYYETERDRISDEMDTVHNELRRKHASGASTEELESIYEKHQKMAEERRHMNNAIFTYNRLEQLEDGIETETKQMEAGERRIAKLMESDPTGPLNEAMAEYDALAKKRDAAVLRAFPNADACSTSSEVTDYLRAKEYFKKDEHAIDTDKRVNMDSMDSESAKACARSLDQFMTDYPSLKGEFAGIDCHDMSNEPETKNTLAYCRSYTDKMVCYSEERFKSGGDGVESYRKDVENKFHPPGTDHASIIDHEYTHAVEKLIKEKRGKNVSVADLIMKRAMKAVDGEYNKDREQDVREALCTYAGRNKGVRRMPDGTVVENKNYGRNTEFVAEAMAEARNSPNPRPYAVAVRKEMEKLMKEVGLM